MPDEPFMLVSLKGDKAKKLAQVMSNPTCTRILDYLAQSKESTESAIAKELSIPLSTVHYNLAQLVAAKLVLVEEFHYSAKGREVNHYKLANKYIIIAPKDDDPGFLDRLRKFIPATVLTLGVAAILKAMQFLTPGAGFASDLSASRAADSIAPFAAPAADALVQESASTLAQDAAPAAAMKIAEAAVPEGARMMAINAADAALNDSLNATADGLAAGAPPLPVDQALPAVDPTTILQAAPHVPWWQSPMVDWFLIGAAFVLVVLVVWELISYLREKRR